MKLILEHDPALAGKVAPYVGAWIETTSIRC